MLPKGMGRKIKMNDTPRTDELEITHEETYGLVGYVESAFARSLERELIEAKADAENYRAMLGEMQASRDRWETISDTLRDELLKYMGR